MSLPEKTEQAPTPATVENVLIRGDLSELTETQRLEYYNRVCATIGLNPMTRPFEYLKFQGKLILYARRDCADQLRKLNGISVEIIKEAFDGNTFTVHVRAWDKTGRQDSDFGAVPLTRNAGGEAASNAKMKAVTKAKRRVTLSISGLGMLDETEVETPAEAPPPATPPRKFRAPETGPNMTRQQARDFGAVLIRTLREAKDYKGRQLALDMAADELARMHRDQTDSYDELIQAIDREREAAGDVGGT